MSNHKVQRTVKLMLFLFFSYLSACLFLSLPALSLLWASGCGSCSALQKHVAKCAMCKMHIENTTCCCCKNVICHQVPCCQMCCSAECTCTGHASTGAVGVSACFGFMAFLWRGPATSYFSPAEFLSSLWEMIASETQTVPRIHQMLWCIFHKRRERVLGHDAKQPRLERKHRHVIPGRFSGAVWVHVCWDTFMYGCNELLCAVAQSRRVWLWCKGVSFQRVQIDSGPLIC